MFRQRGVAQLAARLVWDQDVAGSNPVTPIQLLGYSSPVLVKGWTNCSHLSSTPSPIHNFVCVVVMCYNSDTIRNTTAYGTAARLDDVHSRTGG